MQDLVQPKGGFAKTQADKSGSSAQPAAPAGTDIAQEPGAKGGVSSGGEGGGEGAGEGVPGEAPEVVWLKHRVRQMPADAHNVLWAMLRQQLVHVTMVGHHNSVAAQVGPTLGLFVTWVVRLLVAIVLYRAVDRVLFPIYRPTKIDDRPRTSTTKLTTALDPSLGTMGQSR